MMLLPIAADYDSTTPSCWLWCYYPYLLTMILLPLAADYDSTTPSRWIWCYYPWLLNMMLLPLAADYDATILNCLLWCYILFLAADYVVLSSMQHLEQVHLKQLLNVPMISRLRSCYKFISSMEFFFTISRINFRNTGRVLLYFL